MIILALDTASRYCSAAVYRDGEIIAEQAVCCGLVHSKTVMPMVNNVLSSCSLKPEQVDVFACSSGPGSFTGIRIAVNAVKGLALPFNKPCAGVSTLEAAAEGIFAPGCVVCPVLDARCGQVYTAVYKDGTCLLEPAPVALEKLLDFLQGLNTGVIFCGDGAGLHRETAAERLGGMAHFAPAPLVYQRAAGVAAVAARMAEENRLVSCFELDAVYLRLSQAEREYEAKHNAH